MGNFNIFGSKNSNLLNENGHSFFLKRLLSPNGQHALGNFFLKRFVIDVLGCSFDETQQWFCEKEKSAGKGRIDLYIHSKEMSIIIENKISAKDQESQLYRYWRNKVYGTKETYDKEYDDKKWDKCKLIYLTPSKKNPANKSLIRPFDSSKKYDGFPETVPLERIICITYKKDILNWLKKCKSKIIQSKENQRLIYTLDQYIEWIEKYL